MRPPVNGSIVVGVAVVVVDCGQTGNRRAGRAEGP